METVEIYCLLIFITLDEADTFHGDNAPLLGISYTYIGTIYMWSFS